MTTPTQAQFERAVSLRAAFDDRAHRLADALTRACPDIAVERVTVAFHFQDDPTHFVSHYEEPIS